MQAKWYYPISTKRCRVKTNLTRLKASYKEQVIDLLKRVCTVSVKTMEIVREMETLPRTC